MADGAMAEITDPLPTLAFAALLCAAILALLILYLKASERPDA